MNRTKALLIGALAATACGALFFRFRPKESPLSPPAPPQAVQADALPGGAELIAAAPVMKLSGEDIVLRTLTHNAGPRQLRAELGKPLSVSDEPPYRDETTDRDLPLKIWTYDGVTIHLLDGRIAQISSTSPKWRTSKGLRVGDGFARVLGLYGKPNDLRDGALVYCWEPDSSFCPLRVSISSANTVGAIVNDLWPD